MLLPGFPLQLADQSITLTFSVTCLTHSTYTIIRDCLDPIPAGPILYGTLVDIHLRLLFICLCAVMNEAEGKEHGLHMPEGASQSKPQALAGKWIQLGMVIAQMNENCVNSL